MYISSLQDSKLQVRKRYLLGRAVQLTDGGPETEGGVTCVGLLCSIAGVGLLCSIGEERPMWPAWSTRTRAADLTLHTARQVSGESDDALAIVILPSPGAEPVFGRFNKLAMPPVLSGTPGNTYAALCIAR